MKLKTVFSFLVCLAALSAIAISAILISSVKAYSGPLTYTPLGPWYITCTGFTADFYVNNADQCMVILHGTGVVISGICYTGALYFANFDDARNWLWPPPATPPTIPSTRIYPPATPPSYPSTQMPAPSNGVKSIQSPELQARLTSDAIALSTLEKLLISIITGMVIVSVVILLIVRRKRK